MPAITAKECPGSADAMVSIAELQTEWICSICRNVVSRTDRESTVAPLGLDLHFCSLTRGLRRLAFDGRRVAAGNGMFDPVGVAIEFGNSCPRGGALATGRR
jgi:hypothetical protein